MYNVETKIILQADIKEQHYVSEIRRLEKKLSVLLEEAGARTKLEVL